MTINPKNIFRRIFYLGLGAIGLLLLVLVLLTTNSVGLSLFSNAISSLASNEERQIRIHGLSGIWTGKTRIEDASLYDSKGEFARLTDINANWSPASLLGFKFSAEKLTVASVDVFRNPEPTKDDGKPFSLPVELEINSFSIYQINFSDEIASTTTGATLKGFINAKSNPVVIEGILEGHRLDRENDRLAMDIAYQPSSDKIRLNLQYVEAANGLLSGLANIPKAPAIQIDIKAEGSLAKLNLLANASANDNNVLSIQGEIEHQNGETRFSGKGSGIPSVLAPDNLKQLLDGDFLMDFDVSRSAEGRFDIAKAKVDTDSFYAVATGSIDPNGINEFTAGLTAKYAAVNLSGGIIPGIANLAPKSIALTINGPANQSEVKFSADIPLVDLGATKLQGLRALISSRDFDLKNLSGNYDINAEVGAVMHPEDELQALLAGPHYITGNGDFSKERINWSDLKIRNSAASMIATGTHDFNAKSSETKITVSVIETALPAAAQSWIQNQAKIDAQIQLDGQGQLNVDAFNLDTGTLAISGNAFLQNGIVKSDVKLAVPNINQAVPNARGSINGQLAISGTTSAPEIQLSISTAKINLDAHTISDLALTLEGVASPNQPDLSVKLDGIIDGLPLIGSANIKVKDGIRVVDNLQINNGPNRMTGNLQITPQNIPVGTIKFDFPQIASLAALALQNIEGAASGQINLTSSNNLAQLNVALSSPELRMDTVAIGNLSGQVKIENYLQKPAISGTANIETLRSGNTRLSPIKLNLVQSGEWTKFDFQTQVNNTIPVNATGRVLAKNGETKIDLENATSNFQSIPVSLASPATISIKDKITSIPSLKVGIGGGVADLSGQIGETLDMNIGLSNIDARLANQFARDLGASGRINGVITVAGSTSSPNVTYDLTWRDANTVQIRSAGIGSLQIKADGTFNQNTLRINSTINGNGGLNFAGNGRVELNSEPQLDLGLKGNIPFGVLASTLNEKGLALTGMATADFKISGSGSSPNLNGTIQSSKARFVHAPSGIAIEDLELAIAMTGDQATIRQMRGRLSSGGRIDIDGNIGLKSVAGFPADINVNVKNAVYADGRSVNTKFDAGLKLSGPLANNPLLSGTIDLEKTVITVPDRIPDTIARLNVQHKNANDAVNTQAEGFVETQGSSSSGIALDLRIRAPNQIFIRGRGIDAEMGGDLRLAGMLDAPSAVGGFDLRRGRLSILGKRLNFTNGRISFAGSLIPELNLSAETQSDDVLVTVRVTGPANSPKFKFTSSPELAEDEVLARLIFNRDISNLSALQIVQLGQAAATLTGTGGNSSLLDKFQKLIKVDDLDVKADSETGETTVGVGRYVNDKTYIAVERGANPGTGKATIDLSIGRGVKLRGEATETGKNKAGIFYEREY